MEAILTFSQKKSLVLADRLDKRAWSHYEQGDYAQSELFFRQALEIRIQDCGAEHPELAGSYFRLALPYHAQSRYVEAEQFYQRALELRQKSSSEEYPTVEHIIDLYAKLLRETQREADAVELERRYMSRMR